MGLVDAMDLRDGLSHVLSSVTYPRLSPNIQAFLEKHRQGYLVPVNSLLWNIAVIVLDAVSPMTSLRFQTHVAVFLKGLWQDIVKDLKEKWSNLEFIPNASAC